LLGVLETTTRLAQRRLGRGAVGARAHQLPFETQPSAKPRSSMESAATRPGRGDRRLERPAKAMLAFYVVHGTARGRNRNHVALERNPARSRRRTRSLPRHPRRAHNRPLDRWAPE